MFKLLELFIQQPLSILHDEEATQSSLLEIESGPLYAEIDTEADSNHRIADVDLFTQILNSEGAAINCQQIKNPCL